MQVCETPGYDLAGSEARTPGSRDCARGEPNVLRDIEEH